jgi:ethanolamine utilization protein EutP (predicted NTPase)
VAVITKADLAAMRSIEAVRPGMTVLAVSAKAGEGMERENRA